MEMILSNSTAERISRSRGILSRVRIAVWSTILGVTFGSASAQTNGMLELREALDDTNLVWSTSEPVAWGRQLAETHDGTDAAEGGPLRAGIVAVMTRLSTSVVGPGRLSFWWKLEDAECFQLSLQVGTDQLATIGPWNSGATNWEAQTVTIPAGAQELKWVFQTFCGCDSPSGKAWLDEVQFAPAPALAIPNQTGESLTIEVTGSAGTRVQAEFSTDLVSWAPVPLPQLILEDGRGVLQVPKSGSKAFYRLVALP